MVCRHTSHNVMLLDIFSITKPTFPSYSSNGRELLHWTMHSIHKVDIFLHSLQPAREMKAVFLRSRNKALFTIFTPYSYPEMIRYSLGIDPSPNMKTKTFRGIFEFWCFAFQGGEGWVTGLGDYDIFVYRCRNAWYNF